MDDLEYSEFLGYPCRICGSIEYRYYGGGYNCKEGHRNEELREQLADEDDFDFSRSQSMMRSTQLSQSKMTPQSARVATKKFRKRSGKGEHDVNSRYGITEDRQSELFEEERSRFQRKGDKKKHVIMEAAMQILILQCETLKNEFPEIWRNSEQKKEFEQLARRLFQAYANDSSFPYSHTDSLHPELSKLAPPFEASKYFKRKSSPVSAKVRSKMSIDEAMKQLQQDDLDKELLLDDYDYTNESDICDSCSDGDGEDNSSYPTVTDHESKHSLRAKLFPARRTKPLGNQFSYLNMTFLTHLALIHTGIPVLFSDLARALELGLIPGYRPDFQLSKDIVTVRFNINELRAFHTRNLPTTEQLYYQSRLMLELLSRQCRVPDWKLNEAKGDTLLMRLIDEMALPNEYFPYVKSHLDKSIGLLNFLIFKTSKDANIQDHLYLTPCSLTAAAILFFLRLLYTLDDDDDDDDQLTIIESTLKQQKLPTQNDLVQEWEKRINAKIGFVEQDDQEPVKDSDEFAQLLDLANRMLVNTCILDNTPSIKGIFGEDNYEKACNIKPPIKPTFFNHIYPTDPSVSFRKITLPFDNFKRYRAYPLNTNVHALPQPHRLLLLLIQKLVGITPRDIEKVIKLLFEPQTTTSLEGGRVKEYRQAMGRKVVEKIKSDFYTFY